MTDLFAYPKKKLNKVRIFKLFYHNIRVHNKAIQLNIINQQFQTILYPQPVKIVYL